MWQRRAVTAAEKGSDGGRKGQQQMQQGAATDAARGRDSGSNSSRDGGCIVGRDGQQWRL